MKRFKLLRPGNRSLAVKGSYQKIYSIGSMICDDNTLGFFLFDTVANLIKSVQTGRDNFCSDIIPDLFIAEVDTIGDEVIPSQLCYLISETYLDQFYMDGSNGFTKIQKGTICCKEIEVLDIRRLYPTV